MSESVGLSAEKLRVAEITWSTWPLERCERNAMNSWSVKAQRRCPGSKKPGAPRPSESVDILFWKESKSKVFFFSPVARLTKQFMNQTYISNWLKSMGDCEDCECFQVEPPNHCQFDVWSIAWHWDADLRYCLTFSCISIKNPEFLFLHKFRKSVLLGFLGSLCWAQYLTLILFAYHLGLQTNQLRKIASNESAPSIGFTAFRLNTATKLMVLMVYAPLQPLCISLSRGPSISDIQS